MKQLKRTSTLRLVSRSKLSSSCKLISSRIVFKKKMLLDGTVDKYKARLVIRGFKQRYSIDY